MLKQYRLDLIGVDTAGQDLFTQSGKAAIMEMAVFC